MAVGSESVAPLPAGMVYFPRVIMPISTVLTNLIKYGIQLLVFIGFYVYFVFFTDKAFNVLPQESLIFLPILIFVMALLGLGLGMVISSMTTKYRDLSFLVSFGVQLLMYTSAVMYPLSYFQERLPKLAWVVEYNPMTIVIEAFRYMTLGVGDFSLQGMLYVIVLSTIIFLLGLIIFNKTEKTFIDTV